MKKFFAFVFAILLCGTMCMALGACGETVTIEEINIIAPASTEIRAGETFVLDYVTVPEEAAESIKVNWKISDSSKLSYKDGEFTALTCGTVKVTAHVKGNEATDEIELKVIAPRGFSEYSDTGYSLVYPSIWSPSMLGALRTWTAANGTTNMNISTEELNSTYFKASASSYQTVLETTYSLMGYTVNFIQPLTIEKSTYLGVKRVQVNSIYTLTVAGTTVKLHQTQLIFNNTEANLTCLLTVTFHEEDFNAAAKQQQDTIFSQFMPA